MLQGATDVPTQIISLEHLRTHLGETQDPFILRTSDRVLFKRCRRLWGWLSHLRQGRTLYEQQDYLWFGTGIHYALEDYHGLNLYEHPARAFHAYVIASRSAGILPPTWQEHEELGIALMHYYADEWLRYRPALQTFEVDGIPQVEVNGVIDLGVRGYDGRRVLYGFTMDRIVVDEWGRLWVQEYKTAKQIRLFHFDTDDQVTAYCWCAWKLYQRPIAGVVYQQFLKKIPVLPKVLATGKISTDIRQPTTAALYNKLLVDMFGSPELAPQEYVNCLNKFRAQEDEDKDKFIVRHRIERNQRQLESFEAKVLMELEDITNPNLPLYPNPTRDCEYMCPMQAACVAMDDGSDWEGTINEYSRPHDDGLTQREKEQLRWRSHLPEPNEVQALQTEVRYAEMIGSLTDISSSVEQKPEEQFLEEVGIDF